jgi:hypothetical protein
MVNRKDVTFVFEPAKRNDEPLLTEAHQNDFKADFFNELERLQTWACENEWDPLLLPDFHVIASARFKISRALNPAWSGFSGVMEFPASRVAARRAAVAHELVHVLFPNANRFLAEGLAVYLQAQIGGNPAFPNFGRSLHDATRDRIEEMASLFGSSVSDCLDKIHLVALDRIATPSPLVLQIGPKFYGEDPRGQANIYVMVGSFIQFVIGTLGLQKFKSLYCKTPLVPLTQTAGPADRWIEVYELGLEDLERKWKRQLVAKGRVLDDGPPRPT